MKFADIPQFVGLTSSYSVDVGWDYLPKHLASYFNEYKLDINPDFQRGYCWTLDQKIKYVEFKLKGGRSSGDIFFNCPRWNQGGIVDFVLVDGKQRLDAVLGFLNNEFPIFGNNYRRDFTDRLNIIRQSFRMHVNSLDNRIDVLEWYLALNTGGTVHSDDELNKVRALIELEKKK